jgi:hypothetical protein
MHHTSNCDWHYILNMDQMPVYFLMNAKRTLELIREKMVHIRTSSDDTKRVTVAVMIAADWTVLPLMLICKGQPSRKIAMTEFATYPATHRYQCQANAWMGEVCMIAWVNEVLAPYVAMALDDVVPPPHCPQQLLMPLDGIGSRDDPGAWGGGEAHPRRIHSPLPAH